MSAQHLLSLPTPRVVNLKRPLREQKRGIIKKAAAFRDQLSMNQSGSHPAWKSSGLVSEHLFLRNYFRGNPFSHVKWTVPSLAANQYKTHPVCTPSAQGCRNKMLCCGLSWILLLGFCFPTLGTLPVPGGAAVVMSPCIIPSGSHQEGLQVHTSQFGNGKLQKTPGGVVF